MPRPAAYAVPPGVLAEHRDDGTIILSNPVVLPPVEQTLHGRLRHWAANRPTARFLTQGDRELTYGEAERRRRHIAGLLLPWALGRERPLVIIADNGIDHAVMMLAATSIGVPVAVISPSYAAPAARPWAKLADIVARLAPGLVIADNPDQIRLAMAGVDAGAIPLESLHDLGWLERHPAVPDADVAAAEAAVGPDTVAKLLYTSGSTGSPRPVPNSQRMMVSNMLALGQIWPFLEARPPVSVDWLPWNHTFGGNCCFNLTLWFGGHSHIDSGRPGPNTIGQSVEAIRRWRPNLYYNVPVGFEHLLPVLESDDGFAREFLENLDFVFNAGAPLPPVLRSRLSAVSMRALGLHPAFVAGWGATETAPFATVLHFDQPHANNLGVPIPGTRLKLIPQDDRFELRVHGPNVMPGYWRDETATAAAFDDEGFYRIGDAGRFADPDNPAAGILFVGRVAENFKLSSGTWVNVGGLRLAVIDACEKLVSDVVVTGEGRKEIGLLVFLNQDACRRYLDDAGLDPSGEPMAEHPSIRERLDELLAAYNARQMGSSTCIARYAVMIDPPSIAGGEITEKGYINQRRVLALRAEAVDRLYAG